MITPETRALLNSLRDFQLVEVYFEPIEWSIRLVFTFGSDFNSNGIAVELFEIVHFIFSKDPDDNEGCYVVYEATLTDVEDDGGAKILSSLSYPIKNADGEVFSYPSKKLFHFHLEGDTCLEVVCRKYQVFPIEK